MTTRVKDPKKRDEKAESRSGVETKMSAELEEALLNSKVTTVTKLASAGVTEEDIENALLLGKVVRAARYGDVFIALAKDDTFDLRTFKPKEKLGELLSYISANSFPQLDYDDYIHNYNLIRQTVGQRVSLGRPEQLHTNNGINYAAKLVTDGCSAWRIDVSRTPANRPRHRDSVERFFKIREAEPDEAQTFTTDFPSKIAPKGRKR